MLKKGKLIVIEGTDCSGKETQINLLIKKLKKRKIDLFKYYYPHYTTPTGKIVGGPYLGKEHIGEGFFKEGAANVDPKVATLYYAADFKYSSPKINKKLEEGKHVFLDRYMYSSLAHQGGKERDQKKRQQTYRWMDNLFFNFLELDEPDLVILLYMPYEYAFELKKNRKEKPDQHEANEQHLKDAEIAYLEIAKKYDFKIVNCIKDNKIRTIEDINNEIYKIVTDLIQ